MDFRLGDKVCWMPKKAAAIVMDLLEYDGEDRGHIGILIEKTKESHTVLARECKPYAIDDLFRDHDGPGFPPSDCY